jgi:CRISPR system Cascade subunit CasB
MNEGQHLFLKWWRTWLRPPEDTAAARALRAKLRRADTLEALSEARVHDLVVTMPRLAQCPHVLADIACTLALVETHVWQKLARRLGSGSEPAMSKLRFEKLMRSSRKELPVALRRALAMADYSCDVEALARAIFDWDDAARGEGVRIDWWFDYYHVDKHSEEAPKPDTIFNHDRDHSA